MGWLRWRPIFSHCHGAAEAPAAANHAPPYRPLSEYQPLLRENPSLPITEACRRGFEKPSMMVLRRVDELKPIDGRLDVVPPEAAARLRTGNRGGGPDDGTMRDAKDDNDGGGKGARGAEVRNTTEWGHLRRTTSTKYRTGFAAYRPSGTRHELEMSESESWLPRMRYEMRRPAAPSPQPTHGT